MIVETLDGWKFGSESALEKLVWMNLKELFDLTPFRQQYYCNGEISDILAIDNNKRLVIIELKNVEDRYIIQQLTRYYANLLEEKPFSGEIDYSLPVRLIAVTPNYHRHNLIDRAHSRLDFELFQFSISTNSLSFVLILEEIDRQEIQKKCSIPYQPAKILVPENIPDVPDVLISWLGSSDRQEQDILLKIRNTILTSHEKIIEIVDKKNIQYGSSKGKLCAEICYQAKVGKPILFLYLPLPSVAGINLDQKFPKFGRMRIWIDSFGISYLAHVPVGFGKMKTWDEWDLISIEKRPKSMFWSYSSKSYVPVHIKNYLKNKGDLDESDICEYLITLAIQYWIAKK
jgi:RecB family endonuclease NucS